MSAATGKTQAQLEVLRDQLVPEFAAMLGGEPLSEDPAELERIAATLLVPLELPGMPPELAGAIFGEIERRGDSGAAGLLSAVAAIAGEPLAGLARAAAGRLAHEGIVSPVADRLGALAVREALRIDGPDAELLLALLGRPDTPGAQVAIFVIEHERNGGALVECVLTAPRSDAEARGLIDERTAGRGTRLSIDAAELVGRIVAAMGRSVEVGVALGPDAAIALPLIARALTGDPHGLPRLQTIPPWEDDDEELIVDAAGDEERFDEVVKLLLGELGEHASALTLSSGAVRRDLGLVASTMLRWKGCFGDGILGRWTVADVGEYLLDYFPRRVSADEDARSAAPECAVVFLRFLDGRGSLSGEPLERLEEACRELSAEAAHKPERRPRSERREQPGRRTRRKAQRSARKRNR
jgi:hypothetical protein